MFAVDKRLERGTYVSASKTLRVLSTEYTAALDRNDFDALDAAAKDMRNLVHKRLRRLRHRDYPAKDLNELLSELPPDFNDNVVVTIMNLLDAMPPSKRVVGD